MDGPLIVARAFQFAATISLAGVFACLCCVGNPRASPRLDRQLSLIAWVSLGVTLLSGAAWLMLVSANMSGQRLGTAVAQGVVAIVLRQTRFGQIWLLRCALALVLAILLALPRRRRDRLWRWIGWALAAGLLASLAWAGHGGATPGAPGDLHLAADILHLLAAGAWLGSLFPLALLLSDLKQSGDPMAAALARTAVLRFSLLAAVSVAILLTGGLVNTWFLAGSVPALIGTVYGRLLLAKITIFVAMVAVAAVNLLRMTPRLAPANAIPRFAMGRVLGHLRRNALLEAGLGLSVLCIVAVLGILPPGLHSEPGWPLPFRVEPAALAGPAKLLLAVLTAFAVGLAVAAAGTAAAGRYRATATAAGGLALCFGLSWMVLRPAMVAAYPTSFFAPTQPYATYSVARGADLFAHNCVVCHGTDGRGDGPAAAALAVRPADLTAPHLFAHSPGDLFWWISHGKGDGVMPGFAAVLSPAERWDVVNFVRARAAGVLSRTIGSKVSTTAALPVPDFAFEAEGRHQQTLDRILKKGPALLALFGGPPPPPRLAQLATAQRQFPTDRLQVLAIDLGPTAPEVPVSAPLVTAPDVARTLSLFRTPNDGGETDLMLDRAGAIRARWTASGKAGLPDAATLAVAAVRAAQFAAAPETHAGHQQ